MGYYKPENETRELDSETLAIIVNHSTHGLKEIIIDKEDWPKVRDFRWNVVRFSNTFYARAHRKEGLLGDKQNIVIHRLILEFTLSFIDHANGNGLDNRKSNIRIATQSQNCINRNFQNLVTRTRGVTLNNSGKFQARITIDSKRISLGTYETREEAGMAYDLAAIKLHGKFKRLNFV